MNFVVIMTDTQNRSMVGAYGNRRMQTHCLDRLADTGVRFDRAYTAAPVCGPARGALFSGLYPQVNGAWANGMSPHTDVPMMGTIFADHGYRCAYTGKWHLEGGTLIDHDCYYGRGKAEGGFEQQWWYDGSMYLRDIGPDLAETCGMFRRLAPDDLRRVGMDKPDMFWAHRVADRAIDFLSTVGDSPFVLVTSFDEPHQPYLAPPQYWEGASPRDLPRSANFKAPLTGKPRLQQLHHAQLSRSGPTRMGVDDPDFLCKSIGCNRFTDTEIGRVISAVESLHGDDTTIIYTSDHGDMFGAHGLGSKGPFMYEEVSNIPFIIRGPATRPAVVGHAPVSHLDIIPTMLDLAGLPIASHYHGVSLAPLLAGRPALDRSHVMISWNRYCKMHDQFGELYPIRCMTDGRYKLAINLFDRDELYDLQTDPHELQNRIDDPALAEARADLHASILKEMKRVQDPFRSFRWSDRPWSSGGEAFYWL